MVKSFTWLESNWTWISLVERKMAQEQGSCNKRLAEQQQGRNLASDYVYWFQISGQVITDFKGFATKY